MIFFLSSLLVLASGFSMFDKRQNGDFEVAQCKHDIFFCNTCKTFGINPYSPDFVQRSVIPDTGIDGSSIFVELCKKKRPCCQLDDSFTF
ncbi:unnamed protein product [Oikopleura dioica]|uniref:Uncharacterized protein n=1 Tax=Oikopleura dioica TaxID=34765 RepID=E4XKH0_OIKDI|nr:unnamed protein product [Oikopleura dioica]